jgi:hypothetical protein
MRSVAVGTTSRERARALRERAIAARCCSSALVDRATAFRAFWADRLPQTVHSGRVVRARARLGLAASTQSHDGHQHWARAVVLAQRSAQDAQGASWIVRELDVPNGGRGTRSLVFETEGLIRRLWTFPEDWEALEDVALLALADGSHERR